MRPARGKTVSLNSFLIASVLLLASPGAARSQPAGGGAREGRPQQADARLLEEAAALDQEAKTLYESGNYQAALPRSQRSLELTEKALGPEHEAVATSLLHLAFVHKKLRAYETTENLLGRALRIVEKTSGPNAPQAGLYLFTMAEARIRRGDPVGARPIYERAFSVIKAAEGGREDQFAASIFTLAEILKEEGVYDDAIALYQRSLGIYERIYSPEHQYVSSCLQGMADALRRQGKHDLARPLHERACNVLEKTLSPNNPTVVICVYDLAGLLDEQGDLDAAQPLYERALKALERGHGSDDSSVADVLLEFADLQLKRENYTAAGGLYDRALDIRVRKFGPDDPAVAEALDRRAYSLAVRRDYAAARRDYERALSVMEKNFGAADIRLRPYLRDLAFLLLKIDDYHAARALYERAIALGEREASGAADPDVAYDSFGLGVLLMNQTDYASARQHLQRARDIWEQTHPDTTTLAQALEALAAAARSLKDSKAARDHEERALKIREKVQGPSHQDVYIRKAQLLEEAGDKRAARLLLEQALAQKERAAGPDSLGVATTLTGLASLLTSQQEYDAARALLERALKIRTQLYGDTHQTVWATHFNIGRNYFDQGDLPAARESFLKSAEINSLQTRRILPGLSFAEQRSFLDVQAASQLAALLSTCREGDALARGYGMIIGWKGLLVDSLRRQTAILRFAQDPKLGPQAERLQALRARVAAWYHNAGSVPLADWNRRNDLLTRQKEEAERRLLSVASPADLEDVLERGGGLRALRSALRADEVFVDIYNYREFNKPAPRDGPESPASRRYAAVVISPAGGPTLVDLGDATPVAAAVRAWRDKVLSEQDAAAEWRRLSALIWKPVLAAFPAGARKVWLSPESELSRIPWNLLPPTDRRSERLLVSQVNSARELVLLRQPPARGRAAAQPAILLAGDIDYNHGLPARGAGPARWPRLTTHAEVDTLHGLAKGRGIGVIPLTGGAATKQALTAQMPKVSYIHLATHGFFIREQKAAGPPVTGPPAGDDPLGGRYVQSARNPLVESGVVLAGANRRGAPDTEADDGVLTAEELVGMDLSGCELIALSACETARGEEVAGQGVIGLRASILAAGGRSLLMSLWKVPDEATNRLMKEFYTNYWVRKMGKAEALRKAQEAVRDDPSREFSAPVNWAAWVLVGEAW